MTHAAPPPFEATDSLVPAPIDQSIIEMLRHSPLGPIIDTPVKDVLKSIGVPPPPGPPPPMPPAPTIPPLPALDVTSLFKPLTDLIGSFGSGNLAGQGFDPTSLLTGLSQVIQSAMGVATGAMSAADGGWSGQAATTNAAKSATAAGEGTQVSAKADNIASSTVDGAAIVSKGNAEMVAVITKFSATAAAAMPFIWSPPGQVAMLTAAADALAEATTVVTTTMAELTPETLRQNVNATQIPITGAPTSPVPIGVVTSLLQQLGQPLSMAASGASALGPMLTPHPTARPTSKSTAKSTGKGKGKAASGGGGGGAAAPKLGGGGGGGGGSASTPTTLQRYAVADMGSPATESGAAGNGASSSQSASASRTSTSSTAAGGAMPMGAGAAGAAGAASGARGAGIDGGHGSPDFLVTTSNGSEVVGAMPSATPPVVGGDAPPETETAPDIELRL
ncbi:hypothetical protein [Williamsia sp.]|uniref:hypothetical protein n=1 Tax=Williamsia sp. TaxID=1872085 RepID=UPI001A1995FA|nr:hypothetical protein [Williamsia sp.]MBJ7291455.1 hypothetical protein [Williamsia sp.]